MFELGEFGDQDPEVLQRTVWWLLSLHLGFRTRDESRKLKWGNVKLQINGETGNKKKKNWLGLWREDQNAPMAKDLVGHSAP